MGELFDSAAYAKVSREGPESVPVHNTPIERPAGLPEKFADVQGLITAYSELESRLGQQAPAPLEAPASIEAPAPLMQGTAAPADAPTNIVTNPTNLPTPGDPLTIPTQPAALDFSKYETEFGTTGAISEQSYIELAGMGIAKEMVNAHIAGRVAEGEAHTQAIFGQVGGAAQYQELMTWASRNLNEGEIAAFDAQVRGQDSAISQMAVRGLQARHQATLGVQPTLVAGSPAPSTVQPFRSNAEMSAAMNDPKYATDPAFRQDVMDRVAGMNV